MSEALTWARRWARQPNAADHELLDVPPRPTLEAIRAAYHRIARFAHPDLHRTTLSAAELEELTVTFARASNAYAVLSAKARRAHKASGELAPTTGATRPPPARPTAPPASSTKPPPSATRPPPTSPRVTTAPPPRDPSPEKLGGPPSLPTGLPTGPANAMSPKALGHYRRAEVAMLRGNTTEALLHLRMAIATDPQSAFLRGALAQLEGKPPT